MILLIDNYDSFVFNLQRYFVRLGQAVLVMRNDDLRLANVLSEARQCASKPFAPLGVEPSALVISPGPKRPCDAGYCLELVQAFSGELPILGVCLGHQVIYEAFGGLVVRADAPMHGRASPMRLGASRLFAGLPQGAGEPEVEFARYHSLIAQPESLPQQLLVTARSTDEQIMAIEHRSHSTYGVQFHPESILSSHGYRVLANFLHIAGLPTPDILPELDGPAAGWGHVAGSPTTERRATLEGDGPAGAGGIVAGSPTTERRATLEGDPSSAVDGGDTSVRAVALACLPSVGKR